MGFRVEDATQAISNPALGFRLDPGEPGVLRRAPASQSTLRVAEQEGRNTRRLEAAALREGRIVTRSVRTFTRGDAGAFLATVGGLTRVESVEPRPTPIETAQDLAQARDLVAQEPDAAPETRALSAGNSGLFNGGFRFASTETAQLERDLIVQQAQIERQLAQVAGVSARLTDPGDATAARSETAQLRRQAQQIEREINRIRLARLAEATEQVTRTLLNAAEAQQDTTRALVGAAAGATPPARDVPNDLFNLIA